METNTLPSFLAPYGEAILNWRFGRYDSFCGQNYGMADAYYETAISLVDICIKDNRDKKADAWIFPIMFHVSQFIELYLKGIRGQLSILSNPNLCESDIDFQKGSHNLTLLLNDVKRMISETPGLCCDPSWLGTVENYISILNANIDDYEGETDFTFARYPTTRNKKGTSKTTTQFYNSVSKNVYLNLSIYKRWIEETYDSLDGLSSYVSELLSNLHDMRSDCWGGDHQ